MIGEPDRLQRRGQQMRIEPSQTRLERPVVQVHIARAVHHDVSRPAGFKDRHFELAHQLAKRRVLVQRRWTARQRRIADQDVSPRKDAVVDVLARRRQIADRRLDERREAGEVDARIAQNAERTDAAEIPVDQVHSDIAGQRQHAVAADDDIVAAGQKSRFDELARRIEMLQTGIRDRVQLARFVDGDRIQPLVDIERPQRLHRRRIMHLDRGVVRGRIQRVQQSVQADRDVRGQGKTVREPLVAEIVHVETDQPVGRSPVIDVLVDEQEIAERRDVAPRIDRLAQVPDRIDKRRESFGRILPRHKIVETADRVVRPQSQAAIEQGIGEHVRQLRLPVDTQRRPVPVLDQHLQTVVAGRRNRLDHRRVRNPTRRGPAADEPQIGVRRSARVLEIRRAVVVEDQERLRKEFRRARIDVDRCLQLNLGRQRIRDQQRTDARQHRSRQRDIAVRLDTPNAALHFEVIRGAVGKVLADIQRLVRRPRRVERQQPHVLVAVDNLHPTSTVQYQIPRDHRTGVLRTGDDHRLDQLAVGRVLQQQVRLGETSAGDQQIARLERREFPALGKVVSPDRLRLQQHRHCPATRPRWKSRLPAVLRFHSHPMISGRNIEQPVDPVRVGQAEDFAVVVLVVVVLIDVNPPAFQTGLVGGDDPVGVQVPDHLAHDRGQHSSVFQRFELQSPL